MKWFPGMPTIREVTDRTDTGIVLWRGPSAIGNGADVIALATFRSDNRKIGNMAQIWILPASESSLSALQHGRNSAVCGWCELQGRPVRNAQTGRVKMVDRVCYVNVGQAPGQLWRKLRAGGYPEASAHRNDLDLFCGRDVRLGAYGDPAALPIELLESIVDRAANWTGYSHSLFDVARTDAQRAESLARLLMCSTHNSAQTVEARRRGWRYFAAIPSDRLDSPGSLSIIADSVECPAYTHGVQCADCTLCKGTSLKARSVHVIAHAKTGINLSRVVDRSEEQQAQGVAWFAKPVS